MLWTPQQAKNKQRPTIALKKENGVIALNFDPQILQSLLSYDPVTKKFKENPTIPKKIKGVIIVEKEQTFIFFLWMILNLRSFLG